MVNFAKRNEIIPIISTYLKGNFCFIEKRARIAKKIRWDRDLYKIELVHKL